MSNIPIVDIRKQSQYIQALTTSLGNQDKWNIDDLWIKKDKMGREGLAEVLATLIYKHTRLPSNAYVEYHQCKIKTEEGVYNGCYSTDFKNGMTEEHLGSMFERKAIDSFYSFKNKDYNYRFNTLVDLINRTTGLDTNTYLKVLFAMDAFILNEDRHLNNIVLLYNEEGVQMSPYFDNGLSLLSNDIYRNGAPVEVNKRRVKAKLLSTTFKKHIDNYDLEPIINVNTLTYDINNIGKDALGFFYDVLKYQLNNKQNFKLFY